MTLLKLRQNVSTFSDLEVLVKHFGFMYFMFLLRHTFSLICDSSKNDSVSECTVIWGV